MVSWRSSAAHRASDALKRAKVAFDQGFSNVDCLIRNFSDSGAKLRFAALAMTVPDDFNLICADAPMQKCKVVWRRAGEVACSFSDRDCDSAILVKSTSSELRALRSDRGLGRAQQTKGVSNEFREHSGGRRDARIAASSRIQGRDHRAQCGPIHFNCVIRDLSLGGARLQIESPRGLPEEFELMTSDSPRRPCRVAWRQGQQMGVAFVSAA